MKGCLGMNGYGSRLRTLGLFAAALFVPWMVAEAQFTGPYCVLQGTLTTANGTPAQNATLTLEPSQVMFIGGSQTVVSNAQCSTDVTGQIFGLPTPVSGVRASAQTGVGTLTAGTYYVRFAWYDQFGGVTLASPEVSVQLSTTGELQILPPVGTGPPSATGMNVYIGTGSGTETLQGQTTGTTTQYTQAAALVTGAVLPVRNTTQCRVVANDAGWPTGTGYIPSLVDASGNVLMNYTQQWQFLGPGSTYNLSNGLPYYNGNVIYPFPILTIPFNHNPQSISGPVSMTGFNLFSLGALGVGTAVPAWGVDVEGSGLAGQINAVGGYLINGTAPGVNQCAGSSDGVSIDAYLPCVLSLPTLFYQTVNSNGVAKTQRSTINFGPGLSVADSASPAQTTVDLPATGVTPASYTCANMTVDQYGRISAASNGAGCTTGTRLYLVAQTVCTPATSTDGACTGTLTFAPSFADTAYGVSATLTNSDGAYVFLAVKSKSTGSFQYSITCSFNCGTISAVTADVVLFHN